MNNRHHLFFYLILFFISPLLGLLAGMANFKERNARIILILFIAVFGYTLIIVEGRDSWEQATAFANWYHYLKFDEFLFLLSEIVSLEGGKHLGAKADELYLPFLSYSITQFTSNPAWLFLAAGLVYGFFFIRGISLVYDDMHRNWNIALFIIFVFFLSWKSLEGLNSIRNWTGAWCFFNGAYLYIKTRNPTYIILVMMAPLFHAGYLVITLPFYAYLIIGDRKYVLMGILVASYLLSSSAEMMEPYLMSTGLGENKMGYVRDDADFERMAMAVDNRSFHVRWYGWAASWALQILFFHALLFLGYLKNKNHDKLRTGLASLAILMLSLANVSNFAPVLQNRVFGNFGICALAYLVLHYSKYKPPPGIHRNIVYMVTPGILLFLFTQYSLIGDFMNFKAFVSPLVYPLLGDDPVSIKEFIRTLLS